MSCAKGGGWILRSMVGRLRTPIIDRIEWERNERERIRRIRVIALLANRTSTPFYVFVPVLNQPYKHTHSFLLFLSLLFHSLFFLFWGIWFGIHGMKWIYGQMVYSGIAGAQTGRKQTKKNGPTASSCLVVQNGIKYLPECTICKQLEARERERGQQWGGIKRYLMMDV